jgi:hypothetical protein
MQPAFPRRAGSGGPVTDDQMLSANLGSIRAYVDAGFNVIAELWLEGDETASLEHALDGIKSAVIRLDCHARILEQREAQRGTTVAGTSRAQAERNATSADLVLDSTHLSTRELGARVSEWLGQAFDAYCRLRREASDRRTAITAATTVFCSPPTTRASGAASARACLPRRAR